MPSRRTWSRETKEEAYRRYQAGEKPHELEKVYGISESTLFNWFYAAGKPRGSRKAPKVSAKNGATTIVQVAPVVADEDEIERAAVPARVSPGDKKSFRVRLLVSLGIQATNIEEAISIARGYNGVVEILSVARRG